MSYASQLQKLATCLESKVGRLLLVAVLALFDNLYTYDECARKLLRVSFHFWMPPLTAANNQNPHHLSACQHSINDNIYPDSDDCSTATAINNAPEFKAVTMGRGKQWITVEKKKTASLDFHQYRN
jgi:hypothetical protein